jgi:hypothetical protein
MGTCFVIQPFDKGAFDKRYDDVFAPAIKDADLEPYRVDRDPSATVLIDSIEQGIRGAEVCLADITTDNPNVWFELGFALASGREVVLVCSKERATKFPFDVQHRAIIHYASESTSDFDKLSAAITERIKASIKKTALLEAIAVSPVAESEGLSAQEQVCLAILLENSLTPDDSVTPSFIQKDMERAGYTALAASLSFRSLLKKGMIETSTVTDYDNRDEYATYHLTAKGESWLMDNQDKLVLRTKPKPKAKPPSDEIPF